MKKTQLCILSIAAVLLLMLSACSGCTGGPGENSGSIAVSSERTTEDSKEESTTAESIVQEISGPTESTALTETSEDSREAAEPAESTNPLETDSSGETAEESTEETTEESTEETTEHQHVLTYVDGLPPACTQNGHYGYYLCAECGVCFYDPAAEHPIAHPEDIVIPAVGHSPEKVLEQRASCTHTGLEEHYECVNCHQLFFDYACERPISDLKDITIPVGKHQLVHVQGIDAKCTDIGVEEHWKCGLCLKRFYDDKGEMEADPDELVIPAKGHGKAVRMKEREADCEHEGNITYWYCSQCGQKFAAKDEKEMLADEDVIIPALGHETEEAEEVPATCMKEGVKAHLVCSRCGKHLMPDGTDITNADALVIPVNADAHVLGDWEDDPDDPAYEIRYCTNTDADGNTCTYSERREKPTEEGG
ncbi:MAG: hypothetical protein IKR59_07585 [Lachnospiraceae bacterium]|nr:hypothetical protein [Lachnospiraceae bacterium]